MYIFVFYINTLNVESFQFNQFHICIFAVFLDLYLKKIPDGKKMIRIDVHRFKSSCKI